MIYTFGNFVEGVIYTFGNFAEGVIYTFGNFVFVKSLICKINHQPENLFQKHGFVDCLLTATFNLYYLAGLRTRT